MDIHDPVVLAQDIPEFGLTEGMRGAIVLVFNEPEPGYEVEFCDENGRTIAEVALTPDQIRPLRETT
jgi:hypothetical protein